MRSTFGTIMLAAGAAASSLLSGCSANYSSIKRTQRIADGTLTFIDAKQRAVIDRYKKVCTEPPPDVFSVYAQSLAAGGSVSKGVDPTTLGASANVAAASSETGSTIARTQAYNLIALQTYYNCLSSLNDDSGKIEAPIDRVRLQRLIVATIAIEQLTGALKRNVVVIGAGGSASNGGAANAMALLDQARKDDVAARAVYKTAQDEQAKLEGEDPKCSTLAAQVKAGTLDDKDKPRQQTCAKADAKVADTKKAADDSAKFYQAQLTSAGNGGTMTADARPADIKIVDSTSDRNEQTVTKVAEAVKDIVLENFNPDEETKFFCMRVLYDKDFRQADFVGAGELRTSCAALLMTGVRVRTDPAMLENFLGAKNVIDSQITAGFDSYWPKAIDAAGQPVPANVAALTGPLLSADNISPGTRKRLGRLQAARTKDEAKAAFYDLPFHIQQTLAK